MYHSHEMKITLSGKNLENIEPLLKNSGVEIVDQNPDLVISYGGDGTLLSSERKYPGIPKLPIRNSAVCKKCPKHDEKNILKLLLSGKLKQKEFKKLKTSVLFKDFFAFNDFVIRNSLPIHSIRFKISINDKLIDKLLIGDGIIVSTSWGSTGYFKSIIGKGFNKGFALAFNNTTEKMDPIFLKDQDIITFHLIRGKATLSWDNNPDIFIIDEDSELKFSPSEKIAKIFEPESLRCPNCIVQRG